MGSMMNDETWIAISASKGILCPFASCVEKILLSAQSLTEVELCPGPQSSGMLFPNTEQHLWPALLPATALEASSHQTFCLLQLGLLSVNPPGPYMAEPDAPCFLPSAPVLVPHDMLKHIPLLGLQRISQPDNNCFHVTSRFLVSP